MAEEWTRRAYGYMRGRHEILSPFGDPDNACSIRQAVGQLA
jgi:hypothetical protein